MSFMQFNFCNEINQALQKYSYEKPTSIQEKVIPLILEKKDILAKAQTGSGKTASFVLPILENFTKKQHPKKAKITTLILTPTRELTLQVASTFTQLSTYLAKKPKVVSIIGGQSIGDQLLDIQKGCDIIVATSGRLIDIINKKQIDLSNIEYFILDEADKMLDLGFQEELEIILENLPLERQNLLFSATYPPKTLDIISKVTKDAQEISIKEELPTVENIKQRAIKVNKEDRSPVLRHLLKQEEWKQVLVFMANKRAADNIAAKFRKYGFEAESFHGDLEQEERNYTLEDFKNKKIQILFASDIMARGLHIDDISCVVNFDLPRSPADYIHRIGRTARAGKDGMAISFITHDNAQHFKLIEKRAQIKLEKEEIQGFEQIGTAIKKQKGPEPVKGKRKSKKDKLREQEALKNKKID